MKPAWKNTSRYGQGATPEKRATPNSFEIRHGDLRVTIHRHIYHPPDEWLMSCHDINVSGRVLKAKEIKKAQREALIFVRNWLQEKTLVAVEMIQADVIDG